MSNLLRTTITVPEELLRKTKLMAVGENKTLSELIREALEAKIASKKPPYSKKELFSLAGSIEPRSPLFKNPRKYIKNLRAESDEQRDFSS